MRKRATALVFRGNRVLLVRDRGHKKFSLPGGGVEFRESVLTACIRELHEELGVEVVKIHRVSDADFRGKLNYHHTCLVEFRGKPRINRSGELAEYIWWDHEDEGPSRYRHVEQIIFKAKRKHWGENSTSIISCSAPSELC